MTTLTQGCRTPDRCGATIHVCDPEPGSDAWLADELSLSGMQPEPTADDLAEDVEWVLGLVRLLFDCRRFQAHGHHSDIVARQMEKARRDLLTAIKSVTPP